jgi:hypothetical protein
MKLARWTLVTALVVMASGCEKDGPAGTRSSGAPSAAETELLAHIPAGANIVFGGNYQKLMEYWEKSPLKKLSETMVAATGGGDQSDKLREYMTCWVQQKNATEMLGSMDLASSGMVMTMIFRGLDDKTLTTCADKGGYAYTRSEDGKYIELQGVPTAAGQTTSVGYYFVDPTTAFFAMEVPMGISDADQIPMPTRADLEARLARAKASPATGDSAVMKLVGMADRSKPFWFAGSAAGTPLAGQVESGHGWIDADKDSMTIGFSMELGKAEMATQAVEQFNQIKGSLGMLPPDLKAVAESFLKSAKLEASGKTLTGRFRITNDLLNKAIPAVQGMMGGMGGL